MNTDTSLRERLSLLKRCVFHPFDGFYETKFRHKGSLGIATVILLCYGLLQCVRYQYTGFIFNVNPIQDMNSISIFIAAVVLPLLFCVSNWSVATLFNGKGTLGDIYVMLCYSMVPMILFGAAAVLISNIAVQQEGLLMMAFQSIGIVWSALLVVFGLCTIHEYGLGTTVLTLLATAAAAVIIVFLVILYVTLMQKLVDFVALLIGNLARM